ncbi:MAG: hypothetical protein KF726_06205 [Anaerolineae bacterium]|nr:hypothetical protein [Anaerolineae bacterium]
MKFNRAVWNVRRMDKNVRMDSWRNSVNYNELHTRFALPNKGLWITLIEKQEAFGLPDDRGYRRQRWKYVEARVEPMPESVRQDKQLTE